MILLCSCAARNEHSLPPPLRVLFFKGRNSFPGWRTAQSAQSHLHEDESKQTQTLKEKLECVCAVLCRGRLPCTLPLPPDSVRRWHMTEPRFMGCSLPQLLEEAYNLVQHQVSEGLSALKEECRALTKDLEGTIRSDMDQIVTSKNFLIGKIKGQW